MTRRELAAASEMLARNMRVLRAARRLSQEKLALAAGISQAQVSAIERGKGNPTIASLQRIADVLGVEMAALFAGRDR
jgi:XRE family transcriptional regulator, regulator of sulfur utilization